MACEPFVPPERPVSRVPRVDEEDPREVKPFISPSSAARLAHELDGPAVAAGRATTELGAALPDLEDRARSWGAVATEEEADRLATARAEVLAMDGDRAHWHAPAAAEEEDDLADWLAEHGLPDAVGLAGALAERGLGTDWLAVLTSGMSDGVRTTALSYLESSLGAAGLVTEASEAGARVSGIIRANARPTS